MQPVPKLKLILIIKKRIGIDFHNCEQWSPFAVRIYVYVILPKSIADYNWEALLEHSKKKRLNISNKNVHI